MSTTLEFSIHFEKGPRGQRVIHPPVGPPPPPPTQTTSTSSGRVLRISRLMALAIRLDDQIGKGELRDYADIGRLGHVTRARVTQIMSLLMLAPDIQEALLHLPPIQHGRDRITERQMRPIMKTTDWHKQRRMFSKLVDTP